MVGNLVADDEITQLRKDFFNTFETPAGQRVLKNLRALTGIDKTRPPKDINGNTDIYEFLRWEGQRSVILHIYSKLRKDPYWERPNSAKEINDGS